MTKKELKDIFFFNLSQFVNVRHYTKSKNRNKVLVCYFANLLMLFFC